MGGKSSPDAPDYKGSAEAQAKSSREVTEQQTWANRPDQTNPWGESTWTATPTTDPATGQTLNKWSQNTTIDPELQRSLDAEMGLQGDRAELGRDMMGRAEDEFGETMDWGKFNEWGAAPGGGDEQRQRAEDAIYKRSTDRLDPRFEQESSDLEAQLWAQGLRPGDAAYDREMDNQGRRKEDAYQTAMTQSIMGGGAEGERQQGMDLTTSNYENQMRMAQIAEEAQKRGYSLNEINALISGQQVQTPDFKGFTAAGKSEPTQYLDAAKGQFQAQSDISSAKNAGAQGLMSGLGSAASMAPFMFSDRRLKRNIKLLGNLKGVNIYQWTYVWGEPGVGVMADEVPHAAVMHDSGYLMVDYSRVF